MAPREADTQSFSVDETVTASQTEHGLTAALPSRYGRAAWEIQETRAISLPAHDAVWYAWVNERQEGPMTNAALDQAFHGGQMDAETLVWRDGLDDWTHAADLPELELLLSGATQARRQSPEQEKVKSMPSLESPLGPRPTVWRPARSGLDVESLFEGLNDSPREPSSDVSAPWGSAEAMIAEAQIVDEVLVADFGAEVEEPKTERHSAEALLPRSSWRQAERAWYARWPIWVIAAVALLLARAAWGIFLA
ncbi:MAG: DUF4339 domain-containing protein [Myxococcaceae bacterium]